MYITPQGTSFFLIQCTFHSPGTRGFFFSRAVGRFVVDCGPTDLRPKSRAAWLDRNRKPRMNSLWHPSYSFFVLCAEEDCTFFPILLSVCVLCHKTEFLEMSMLQLLNRFKDTTERVQQKSTQACKMPAVVVSPHRVVDSLQKHFSFHCSLGLEKFDVAH